MINGFIHKQHIQSVDFNQVLIEHLSPVKRSSVFSFLATGKLTRRGEKQKMAKKDAGQGLVSDSLHKQLAMFNQDELVAFAQQWQSAHQYLGGRIS